MIALGNNFQAAVESSGLGSVLALGANGLLLTRSVMDITASKMHSVGLARLNSSCLALLTFKGLTKVIFYNNIQVEVSQVEVSKEKKAYDITANGTAALIIGLFDTGFLFIAAIGSIIETIPSAVSLVGKKAFKFIGPLFLISSTFELLGAMQKLKMASEANYIEGMSNHTFDIFTSLLDFTISILQLVITTELLPIAITLTIIFASMNLMRLAIENLI